MRVLLLLFIIVPVVEMWLLIEVGSVIGAWPTIGLVLLTAMAGLALLRREGAKTLLRGNLKLERGEMPAREMLEGLILAICGALLLTPGFATDIIGFLGLVPLSRRWIVSRLLARGGIQMFQFSAQSFHRPGGPGQEDIIEGEYQRKDDYKNGPNLP